MSRVKRFAFSIVSGYASLAANIVFSLVSVPLAMHYLSNEEFGLWVAAAQMATYLSLIELGMMGSISRILIDHKDDATGEEYGAVIKTGGLVLLVQGVLLALVGAALSFWLAGLFDVPARHLENFRWLLGGQTLLLGLFFAGRILGFVLQAHQRYDEYNHSQMLSFAASLLALWGGFAMNLGVCALLAGSGAGLLASTGYCWLAVRRHRLLPQPGRWGRANRRTFRVLFRYGMDVFLLAVGQQLICASQVLVIGRTLGLEAAAVWSVATKMFIVAQQLVWRIFDFSAAAFAEMMARGERARLLARYRDVVMLTASTSIVVGLAVAVCNRSFLELWTRGRMAWGLENDVLMALSVIGYAITRCHIGLTGVTKQIRAMKFILVFEGLLAVGTGLLAAGKFGISGVILCGIAANLLCTGSYGVWRVAKYFEASPAEIMGWLKLPLRLLTAFLAILAVVWWLTNPLSAPIQLSINCLAAGLLGLLAFWRLGLPAAMQQELAGLLGRLRQRLSGAR